MRVAMPSDVNGQVVSGFEAMTAGDWPGAHDALLAALAGGDVPEALLGMANGCYWLGDLPAMMQSLERACAAARQSQDPVLAAGSPRRANPAVARQPAAPARFGGGGGRGAHRADGLRGSRREPRCRCGGCAAPGTRSEGGPEGPEEY